MQTRKQSRLAKKKARIRPRKIFFVLPFILLFLVLSLFYFLSPRKWGGNSKFSVAIQKESGDVNLNVYDPTSSSITTFEIPKDTEVQAAHQLGTWKLGSISKLGRDKKLGNDFLKNTIIKSFGIPVEEVTDTNMSNLFLVDRIKLLLFASQVGPSNKYDIDLAKTMMLDRGRLADGSDGYSIRDSVPTNIKSYFVIDKKKPLNVDIKNFITRQGHAFLVSKVLDVLGINVASIQDALPREGLDCLVIGNEKDVVTKISRIFGCDFEIKQAPDNFDIEVSIGEKFRDRF